MSKIGIITFHESDNYGTVLQAFALQSIIEELGYHTEIIKYRRPTIVSQPAAKESATNRILTVLRVYGIKGLLSRKKIKIAQNKVKNKFEAFRNERLVYSEVETNSFDAIKSIEEKYDAFVVGSDMVWSIDRAQNLDIYFLKFTSPQKRISFSPSFGSMVIDEERKNDYIDGLKSFNYLSCREASGIDIINSLTGRKAVLTADPTLSCNASVWNSFCSIHGLPERYILVYLFEGIPKWMKSNVSVLSKHYNAKIIEIPVEARGWCRAIKNNNGIIVGPEEFVDLFKHATCVVTNSYHGLMFSLIFSKPFYVVQRSNQRWGQFEDRLSDMLSRIGCEKRAIAIGELINRDTLLENEIDIDERLVELKKQSIDYLKEALSFTKDAFVGDLNDKERI